MGPTRLLLSALAALACACSAAPPATSAPSDAGTDAKHKIDAGPRDAAPADVDPRYDRMTSGGGAVLANMKLAIVYIGDDTDGAPSRDEYVTWLVGSGWWGIMNQYGVGTGSVVGSVRVPKADVFQPGDVDANGVTYYALVDARVDALVQPADGGPSAVPAADAYLVFLPWGVNVDIGGVTCDMYYGYHSATLFGHVPYAIMPPCTGGHSGTSISHELAEMATDPFPESGWADHTMTEGEIGDLCNAPAFWDGQLVTRLWSNEAGACVP